MSRWGLGDGQAADLWGDRRHWRCSGTAAGRRPVGRCISVGRDAARLAAIAGEVGASYSVADVEDPASFAHVAAEARPALSGLVYAVGTITLKPIARLSSGGDFLRDFRLDAEGAALAVQAALPALEAARGRRVRCCCSTGRRCVARAFRPCLRYRCRKAASRGPRPRARHGAGAEKSVSTPSRRRSPAPGSPRRFSPASRWRTPGAGVDARHAGRGRASPTISPRSAHVLLLARCVDGSPGQVYGVDGGRSTLGIRRGSGPPYSPIACSSCSGGIVA